jgi:hypothetical protein
VQGRTRPHQADSRRLKQDGRRVRILPEALKLYDARLITVELAQVRLFSYEEFTIHEEVRMHAATLPEEFQSCLFFSAFSASPRETSQI